MMMPYSISKTIAHLVRELEKSYGDYAKYTDLLDQLHTLIINDAQSFKPKRTYNKKKETRTYVAKGPGPEVKFDESTADTPLVGAPDTEEEAP